MSNGIIAEQPAIDDVAPRAAWHPLRACYDLLGLIGLALLLPLLPLALLRVPLGLALTLLGPGYVLQAALFARRADLDGPTRLAISFGLSAATLPLLALILDALPWGIRPQPMVFALTLWLALWGALAAVRRYRLSAADAAVLPPRISLRGAGRGSSARLLAGLGLLAVVLGSSGWALLQSQAAPPPTEFYALGSDDLAEAYPREAAPGQPIDVQLGITNREDAPMRYRIEVRSGAAQLAEFGPIAVAAGATWQEPVRYALPQPGDDQPIDLLLYREGDSAPYRQLRLWVDVREP
jgi:uncharacterized membrane protein